jgi:HSP20 family protein
MSVCRWDPKGDLCALEDRVNQWFDESFPPAGVRDDSQTTGGWTPSTDIHETSTGIVFHVELAGMRKDQVTVEFAGNVITVKGVRHPPAGSETDRHVRRERYYGPFQRVFSLRDPVDVRRVRASMKNGVLRLEILKSPPE